MKNRKHSARAGKQRVTAETLMGRPAEVRSVREPSRLEGVFRDSLPSFGGGYLRRFYDALDRAIGAGIPLMVAVAGPITVSNQHRAWLNDLLNTGWVGYISVTDAICYHDGHDSLRKFRERPIHEVAISGRDREYGAHGVIRVTDLGFKEQILFDQDRFFTTLFRQPELQRKMTGTEFRNIVGKYYAAQESEFDVAPGLLSACWRNAIPVFVGAPGDGSAFLNSVKLWALAQAGLIEHKFEIDIHKEVFESCAYHYWGLRSSRARKLAVLILGGGVPKNFILQPEPTLSQIFLLPAISGYSFDVQIVGAQVTDGSLSSCHAEEAHTWGKVEAAALDSNVASINGADYSMLMPFVSRALLEKREFFERLIEQIGPRKLFARHPEARGYLRQEGQLRLFDQRDELMQTLLSRVTQPAHARRLMETWDFPLQLLNRTAV
ncbi:MAG: deoxyhypusine synthase family protein [bacterium]|nr:deoxyhypusine synthase family protein [bacterium]